MVRAFDNNSSRSLALDEFQRLHNFLINVQTSFQQFDKDKSGKLSTVRQGLSLCRVELSGWMKEGG